MRLPEVIAVVRSLELPAGDFALHGSAPMLAHGLIEEIADIDIVSRGAAWRRALELGPSEPGSVDDIIRPYPRVEIFNGWLGDDAHQLIDEAELIEGVPFVTLQAVLRFKRRLNRPKDRPHIELIERHLEQEPLDRADGLR